MTHPRAQELADALRARREDDLHLSMDAVARRGGPQKPTLVRYEAAEIPLKPQARTLAALDQALDWPNGYAQSILDGNDPGGTDRRGTVEKPEEPLSASEMQIQMNEINAGAWGALGVPGTPPEVEETLRGILTRSLKVTQGLSASQSTGHRR